jgi:hypothetical protein
MYLRNYPILDNLWVTLGNPWLGGEGMDQSGRLDDLWFSVVYAHDQASEDEFELNSNVCGCVF